MPKSLPHFLGKLLSKWLTHIKKGKPFKLNKSNEIKNQPLSPHGETETINEGPSPTQVSRAAAAVPAGCALHLGGADIKGTSLWLHQHRKVGRGSQAQGD